MLLSGVSFVALHNAPMYLGANALHSVFYKLTKPASQISIAEIIRLMDGALAATESVSKYFFTDTPLRQEKKLINIFKEIRDYISKKLENLTLADLV